MCKRSIPARAGEPCFLEMAFFKDKVHPRACGGTGDRPRCTRTTSGPSPRVRGNRTTLKYHRRFHIRVGVKTSSAAGTWDGWTRCIPCSPTASTGLSGYAGHPGCLSRHCFLFPVSQWSDTPVRHCVRAPAAAQSAPGWVKQDLLGAVCHSS